MHKVAIGMPVWNGEQFVSEAIESILGQTYGDLELVISDNASTDGTAEICSAYAKQDRRIRCIRQEKNIGAAPNHHEVFRRSSGQYFKWACHDDVLAPEFIHECVRALDADEAAVVCSPSTVLINEDGSSVSYSSQDNGLVDNYGNVWRVVENPRLTSPDPADRFTAVLCNIDWCFEIYGLIRRSALERVLNNAILLWWGQGRVGGAQLHWSLLLARGTIILPTMPPWPIQLSANQSLQGHMDLRTERPDVAASANADGGIYASGVACETYTGAALPMLLCHRTTRRHHIGVGVSCPS